MDGKELVPNPTSQLVAQTALPKPADPPGSRPRHMTAMLASAVVLTAFFSVIYFGQRSQPLTSDAAAIPIQSLPPTSAGNSNLQTSSAASLSNSMAESAQSLKSPEASVSPGETENLADTSLTKAPARTASAANQSGSVIVRLTNGVAINADDAGETKNGVWYRQGGMVTFLKRSQVRAIERRRSSTSPAKLPADNKNERTASATAPVRQNQLRLRQLEPATVKQESRVTSFLKKTGKILSKPFKR